MRENRCTATNLPWTLDGGDLARSLGLAELVLLNDLEAAGRRVPGRRGTDRVRRAPGWVPSSIRRMTRGAGSAAAMTR